MPFSALRLTGEQIRAARALARIEQTELASRSQLSLDTIKRLERIRGVVEANNRTVQAIHAAFEALGVTFDAFGDGGVGVSRQPVAQPAPAKSHRAPDPHHPSAQRGAVAGRLHRVVYSSRAKPEVALHMKKTLDEIAGVAVQRNAELGVTGALFSCHGYFLGALEGPKDAVYQLYGAISADPRHCEIRLIESRSVSSRQFSDWAMCCGLFRSDESFLAHEPAFKDGFRPDLLTAVSALGLLSIVRDLQSDSPRCERSAAGTCTLAGQCLDYVCAPTAEQVRAPAP